MEAFTVIHGVNNIQLLPALKVKALGKATPLG